MTTMTRSRTGCIEQGDQLLVIAGAPSTSMPGRRWWSCRLRPAAPSRAKAPTGRSSPSTTTAASHLKELIDDLPELKSLAQVDVIVEISQHRQRRHDHRTATEARKRHQRSALARPDVAGAVVTHGTGTLEETAYFLQLTGSRTSRSQVVGAMRPLDRRSAATVR